MAHRCEAEVRDTWLWHGRHVKLADGATVTMADTEANQAAFPQESYQNKGLGFPIARLVVLLSLATAMTTGMAMAPYAGKETGERALLRELFDQLEPNDVLLADKLYCVYFIIALLAERQVDMVMVVRLHHLRKENVCRTQRLGKKDLLIVWLKPDRPQWMDKETYARMPKRLELRRIHVHVAGRGWFCSSKDGRDSAAPNAHVSIGRNLSQLAARSFVLSPYAQTGSAILACPQSPHEKNWENQSDENTRPDNASRSAAPGRCRGGR